MSRYSEFPSLYGKIQHELSTCQNSGAELLDYYHTSLLVSRSYSSHNHQKIQSASIISMLHKSIIVQQLTSTISMDIKIKHRD